MNLKIEDYCNINNGLLRFSRLQASRFAKEVAGDFNPIHDVLAKRFCVPGDLLFAILLTRYGVGRSTHVDFSGMVGDGVSIELPENVSTSYLLTDHREKEYLELTYQGDRWTDAASIETVINAYVRFSGQTFPDILVALMKDQNIMINPDRPLVIYKSMSIEFGDSVPAEIPVDMVISLESASLSVDGRKGQADLRFNLESEGQIIGRGEKIMLLSGLKEFDSVAMDDIIAQYAQWKLEYVPPV